MYICLCYGATDDEIEYKLSRKEDIYPIGSCCGSCLSEIECIKNKLYNVTKHEEPIELT